MRGKVWLAVASGLSFTAALLHVATIVGGADWYRFLGAGEQMAQLAEAGSHYPTIVTLIIAAILAGWGLFALSGAGILPRFPLLRSALVTICFIYLSRGVAGLILPLMPSMQNNPVVVQNSIQFWLISSSICLLFGLVHLVGIKARWQALSHRGVLNET